MRSYDLFAKLNMHMVHTYTCRQNTYTHLKKTNKLSLAGSDSLVL